MCLGACTRTAAPLGYQSGSKLAVGPFATRDTAMGALIAPYRQQMGAELQRVIIQNARRLSKTDGDQALGNLVADATLWAAKKEGLNADFGLVAYGGLRIPLEQGPITVGHIYELMPFENEVVVLELTQNQLYALLSKLADKRSFGIANASIAVDQLAEPHAYTYYIDMKPIEKDKKYRVATNSYLADGGDGLSMLTNAPRLLANMGLRDAIIQYLETIAQKGDVLDLANEERIVVNYAK